jgi:hypothetical protein
VIHRIHLAVREYHERPNYVAMTVDLELNEDLHRVCLAPPELGPPPQASLD